MVTIRKIENDTAIDRILNRDFVSIARPGYVEVGVDKFCLPLYYREYEERIRNFEVYDDDVFITGHPKTGTTWLQEMVWLLLNNLDYAEGAKDPIFVRSSQIEFASLFDFQEFSKGVQLNKTYLSDPFQYIIDSKRPRCLKTHLLWSLIPEQIQNGTKQPKIINVIRNPGDTCVSLFYHSQAIESYKGTFDDFCELFLAGRVSFGPFWKQVLSYWNERQRPNMLILKYTEIKQDRVAVIRKVAKFLGKSLTEDQIEKLTEHLSFESMKKNPAVNHVDITNDLKNSGLSVVQNAFIRSGNVGGYKNRMSPEMLKKFEMWTDENIAGTGLSFE